MKIYTSEIEQFGKELHILNQKVKFDGVGCAEVDDEFADQLESYSKWYSKTKHAPKKVEQPKTVEDKFNEQQNEDLKMQIVKLQKQDEARQSKIKAMESENRDIRTDMGKVVEERDALKKEAEAKQQIWDKEKEDLEHRFELALLEMDDLKDMCKKLGLKEEDYAKKRSKKAIIELIIKASN